MAGMTRGRRRDALKRRMRFLAGRLASTERHQASAYDGAELSALEWILERERNLGVIQDAWNVPGPAPAVHRAAQERLRREWPTLANALDKAGR